MASPFPRTSLELPRPSTFLPARWAAGGHLQTLAGWLLPSHVPEPPWEREHAELPDGDRLALRIATGRSDTVVHLFHGLGGSADAPYMRRAAARFHHDGHTVVSANHRGAGEGRGLARHPYHGGSALDVAAVIQAARRRFPDRLHIAVGYSLSGNMLLLLLGRGGAPPGGLPDAAIAVNPPADLERGSRRMGEGFNRVYDLRFTRLLLSEVEALGGCPVRVRTLREFDQAFTAPRGGFRDRDDYYAQCSCGPVLGGIQVPTVLLAADDDPLAPSEFVRAFALSPRVHFHAEATGGHMGFVASDMPGHRWLEPALAHYVEALQEHLRLEEAAS